MFQSINKDKPVICWFSGGITSAVACKVAIDLFGKENCKCIFIDTKNEDDDTYRFLKDCEKWYGINIESITMLGREIKTRKGIVVFNSIRDIWRHYKSLNVASGAICSSVLKRDLRKLWEKENKDKYSHQVFGFEFESKEFKRAFGMNKNYSDSMPIFPLLLFGYSKKDCLNLVQEAGIRVPESYPKGYHNNNCQKTKCIQGGIGYWQKVQREDPKAFDEMAAEEHFLTALKGEPVTMLKDQSNEAKEKVKATGDKTLQFVFLKPHPDYPHIKDLSMMQGKEPQPLTDCNGFCGINDLDRNPTEQEINFQQLNFDFNHDRII